MEEKEVDEVKDVEDEQKAEWDWCVPAGNSPSPLFFVSGRNTGVEVL